MATAKKTTEEIVDENLVGTEFDPEMTRRVTIRLPIVPGKERQEAQFVRVNGKTFVIPRGVEMEVPKYVAIELQRADEEAIAAMRYQMYAQSLSSTHD